MAFHRQQIQKASKIYTCDWCGAPIIKDEQYMYMVGSSDGDFYTGRYHLKCDDEMSYTMDKCDHRDLDLNQLHDALHEIMQSKIVD